VRVSHAMIAPDVAQRADLVHAHLSHRKLKVASMSIRATLSISVTTSVFIASPA
jgi:hypothetical protein